MTKIVYELVSNTFKKMKNFNKRISNRRLKHSLSYYKDESDEEADTTFKKTADGDESNEEADTTFEKTADEDESNEEADTTFEKTADEDESDEEADTTFEKTPDEVESILMVLL